MWSSVILARRIASHFWRGSKMSNRQSRALRWVVLALTGAAAAASVQAQPVPNPILYLTGSEYYSTGGKNFIRYSYDVLNKGAYPATMFAAAPSLPPCGVNASSSRSWVDFYDQQGKRLYGFCALGDPANLGK